MTIEVETTKSVEEKDSANSILKNKAEIETHVKQILDLIGEDSDREGLIKTPHRVAKMFSEVLEGYFQDLADLVNDAVYENEYESDNIVMVSDINYKSMCEHHMLPFTGKAHVAYVPDTKIIGLSKIPRIVNMFARRLQVQERLTQQVIDAIDNVLAPKGIMVVLEGHHECASLRGVEQENLNMKTVAATGLFEKKSYRKEFFSLL